MILVSFNVFGELDDFEEWDAADEKERREYKREEMRDEELKYFDFGLFLFFTVTGQDKK